MLESLFIENVVFLDMKITELYNLSEKWERNRPFTFVEFAGFKKNTSLQQPHYWTTRPLLGGHKLYNRL